MKRSANVKRFSEGWFVECFEETATSKEKLHELLVYAKSEGSLQSAMAVALGRAEMWVKCGLAVASF